MLGVGKSSNCFFEPDRSNAVAERSAPKSDFFFFGVGFGAAAAFR